MFLAFFIALGCNNPVLHTGCQKYIELNMAQTKENPLSDRKMILSPDDILSVEEVVYKDTKMLRVKLGSKEKLTSVVAIDSKEYNYILEQMKCNHG